MTPTLTTKSVKPFYNESEAAEALGVSVDRFRNLVKVHIAQTDDEANNIGTTTFQASDLVVLKFLAKLAPQA